MGKYIVKRLFAMALTLFIIITISFFAIRLIPGDVLGEGANPELRAAMRARYHLDKPLAEQYAIFLRNFISFDFGESITLYPRRPVFEIMAEKIPMTLVLNLFSLIITIPIGIACGIIAALKKEYARGQRNLYDGRYQRIRAVVCIRVAAAILLCV